MYREVDAVSTLLRRVWVRGLQALQGSDARWTTWIYGYKVTLRLSEQIQKMMAIGLYEPEESHWIEGLLRPGMTFVDVGANFGHYMLLAARFVGPRGQVFAFEPSPVCAGQLEAIVRENALAQIRFERAALGSEPGQLDLVLENPGLHSPSFLATSGAATYSVPVLTLDEYASRTGLDHIDVMKIDVEGFEPNVIEGAAELIKHGRIDHILCELNDIWLARNGSSAHDLERLILSYGYSQVRTKRYDYHSNTLYSLHG